MDSEDVCVCVCVLDSSERCICVVGRFYWGRYE